MIQTIYAFIFISRIKIDLLNQEYTVFYVGTNLGRVYKIVQFYRNNEPNSKLLDIFEVAPDEPIQVMEISQSRKSLYVATDNRIKQIDLAMCNRRYDSCYRCVKDPYCGWDKETNVCRPYELGLLQVWSCIVGKWISVLTSFIFHSFRMLPMTLMTSAIRVFSRRRLSLHTGKAFILDALWKFQKCWRINKWPGIIIQRKKDGM